MNKQNKSLQDSNKDGNAVEKFCFTHRVKKTESNKT